VTEERTFPKLIKRFDWTLFLVSILLTLIGIIFIYSATLSSGKANYFCSKQIIAFGLGLFAMVGLTFFPYTFFKEYVYRIYFLSLLVLFGVLLLGTRIRGTRGWYDLGFFYFQPAEIIKIFYILILAGYLERKERYLDNLRNLFFPFLSTISFVGLILRQPDFSSTLVFFPVFLVLLYLAGVRISIVLSLFLYFVLTLGLLLIDCYLSLLKEKGKILFYLEQVLRHFSLEIVLLLCIFVLMLITYWFLAKLKFGVKKKHFFVVYGLILAAFLSTKIFSLFLKQYQRQRLLAFLDPAIDPLGAGYNVLQSKIAIGSGRIFGKGLFLSTQARLGFLPERHTDFIFSLLSEEMGFLGSFIVLILYFILVYRSFAISLAARDRFGNLVAAGIGTMFAFYCIVNIGMTMGIMPATGLPSPLLSYGGSSLLSVYFALGLLFSIYTRRFVH